MRKAKIMFVYCVHWRLLIEKSRHSRRDIVCLWVYRDWTSMYSSGGWRRFCQGTEPFGFLLFLSNFKRAGSANCFKRYCMLFFFGMENTPADGILRSCLMKISNRRRKTHLTHSHVSLWISGESGRERQLALTDGRLLFSSLLTLSNNQKEKYFSLQSYRCNQQCLLWEAFRDHLWFRFLDCLSDVDSMDSTFVTTIVSGVPLKIEQSTCKEIHQQSYVLVELIEYCRSLSRHGKERKRNMIDERNLF